MSKWKTVKLGEVFEITSGGTPSKNHPEYYENGTIYWVKTGDLKGKYLISVPSLITEAGLKNSSAKIFPVETTLLAMYGATIGACSILKVDAATNQACAAFLPNADIDTSFFYYFLCSKREQFIKLGVGGAQPNISATILKNVNIPLPPLEEQKRIADILDKASNLIDLRKQQLEKMDLLIKSKFIDMFGDPVTNPKGWDVKTLADICSLITDGTHQTPQYVEEGYIFLSSKNVTTGKIDWSNIKHISENLHKELYKRLKPRKGDILLAKNGTTGIAAIVDKDVIFDIYVSLALLRPKQNVVSLYLLHGINNFATKRQFDDSLKGIGVPNLHLNAIREVKLILPPAELQNQFAEFVEQVEKQKVVMQQSLEKMEMNYKALMQEYF